MNEGTSTWKAPAHEWVHLWTCFLPCVTDHMNKSSMHWRVLHLWTGPQAGFVNRTACEWVFHVNRTWYERVLHRSTYCVNVTQDLHVLTSPPSDQDNMPMPFHYHYIPHTMPYYTCHAIQHTFQYYFDKSWYCAVSIFVLLDLEKWLPLQ